MNIGFAPCGFTLKEIISKLIALGGINKNGYDLLDIPTALYWYIDSRSGEIRCNSRNILDVRLNPHDIPEKINQIVDLPEEMRIYLVKKQIKAGNVGNLKVLTQNIAADKSHGGFNWKDTPEGAEFWDDFFSGKYFLYYTLNYKQNETKLQGEETSIGRSENITGSGIRCERRKPTIASGHLRDRKAIKC